MTDTPDPRDHAHDLAQIADLIEDERPNAAATLREAAVALRQCADERRQIDSGVRYCLAHDGLLDADTSRCDFASRDPDDDLDCTPVPLTYAEGRP